MAAGGAGNAHRRVGGDAAGIARGAHHFPAAAAFFHFHNRHAHRVLAFARFVQIPIGAAVFKQQTVVDIFVVHRQQAVIGSLRTQRHGEISHAVVVHTGLSRLLDGGVAAVLLKGGHITGDAHRVAPFIECAGAVALGHHHFVFSRKRHRAETQAARARHIAAQHRSLRRIGQAQHTERQSRSHAQCTAALQHGAA